MVALSVGKKDGWVAMRVEKKAAMDTHLVAM